MNDSIDRQPESDRRARTHKEIKQLITERNEVLSLYCNIAGCDGSKAVPLDEIDSGILQEFCQVLIDYIATGHFELYSRITEGEEKRQDMITLADAIYPRIAQTTQIAVDFNDLYDGGNKYTSDLIDKLPDYLSKLGEELATRIELEDKLIHTLLTKDPSAEATTLQ